MPGSSGTDDDLSVNLSSLSADLPNPTPKAPFSSTFSSTFSSDFTSTFQSKFSSPGFTSRFSSNFTIDLGKPNFTTINLPTSGVNVPDVISNTTSTTRPRPANMETTSDDRPAQPAPSATTEEEKPRERATKIRFKSKEKTSRSSSGDRESRRQHRHRSSRPYRDDHRHDDFKGERSRDEGGHDDRERRHRRHKRRRREEPPPPPPPQANNPLDAEPTLDPETAFRESLFDAMADDEGAAYWEAIYGQPIHIYPQETANPQTGELERMTEEEYAAHVRQKMWEKTHSGIMEERARRQKAREERARRDKEREASLEEERRIQREVERSLRRGEERRKKREWTVRFREYTDAWEGWDGSPDTIPWPTKSGQGRDAKEEEEVRRFFVRGMDLEALGEREFAVKLKEQRVRWHPDKMQQKLGGKEKVDERVMRDVTTVFQVIDTLYDDIRSKSK
ncbi:hypothetical protein VP1G_01705 [Cytospora mali]|uniref:J domain-containing protein n=1 Tax=Cytospora mali TaxID=578113 RepID=A0A194URZ7_CYTMA|nr:hypothetical protein VP1G_01705 [Valsa mali var. pyri (nom. inval.)]